MNKVEDDVRVLSSPFHPMAVVLKWEGRGPGSCVALVAVDEPKWDTENVGIPWACVLPSDTIRGASLWEGNLAGVSSFFLWPWEGRAYMQWNVNWQRFAMSHSCQVLASIMLMHNLSSCCSVHEMSDLKRWVKCSPVSLTLLWSHSPDFSLLSSFEEPVAHRGKFTMSYFSPLPSLDFDQTGYWAVPWVRRHTLPYYFWTVWTFFFFYLTYTTCRTTLSHPPNLSRGHFQWTNPDPSTMTSSFCVLDLP